MLFKLVDFDQDTIVLLFFNGYICLEIKALNIVHDLNSKSSAIQQNRKENPTDSDELNNADLSKMLKCLNYPLQQLCLKSNIDSHGNHVASPYTNSRFSFSKSSNDLFKSSKEKVPLHVRYCISLILGEFGDANLLQSSNKYKFVRDLPLVSFFACFRKFKFMKI